MNVVFRADASSQIGSGHVMRCLTLADQLRAVGADVHFICCEYPGHMGDIIRKKNYPLHWLLPSSPDSSLFWQQDAEQTADALRNIGTAVDWLVVDHYMLDSRWESALRHLTRKIMVIDDLANRQHDCDLILDQNLYNSFEKRYDSLVSAKCRKLLGPQYVLLRPEFIDNSGKTHCKKGDVRRIMLFFGGSDPAGETSRALDALSTLSVDICVDVVVGSSNLNRDQIEIQCRNMSNVNLHLQVENMAELMSKADLAIGSGGTVCWERCITGVPTMAWPTAENQVEQLHYLARIGAVYMPDPESIKSMDGLVLHIRALMENPDLRSHMSERAASICDGRGTDRVRNALLERQVTIRRATMDDCQDIYQWRNHSLVRRYSGSNAQITWEEHRQWFEDVLCRTDRVLLLGEYNQSPIGVVRYDFENETAEISIYLVPELTGRGFGPSLLKASEQWLHQNYADINEIKAVILADNTASIKLFERAGYRQVQGIFWKRF